MKTYGLYLNGRWVESTEKITVVNPATEESIAQICTVDQRGVKKAIEDAHAAFGGWRELPAKARGDYLLAVAAELNRRSEEIARTITLENGKPLSQSKGEVAMSVDHLRWFAEECRRA